jgi:hypothetical protein
MKNICPALHTQIPSTEFNVQLSMNKKKANGLDQEFTNRSGATMDGLKAFSLQSKLPAATYLIP